MEARLATVEHRLEMAEKKFDRISDSINENTNMTREMYDLFRTLKSGFKVLGWLGAFAKWMLPIVAILTTLIIFFKTGTWQPPKT